MKTRLSKFVTKLVAVTLTFSALISGIGLAQTNPAQTNTNAQLGPPYRKDRVLIRVKPGTTAAQMSSVHPQGATVHRAYQNRIWVISLPSGVDARTAIPVYQASSLVEYAESRSDPPHLRDAERSVVSRAMVAQQFRRTTPTSTRQKAGTSNRPRRT